MLFSIDAGGGARLLDGQTWGSEDDTKIDRPRSRKTPTREDRAWGMFEFIWSVQTALKRTQGWNIMNL